MAAVENVAAAVAFYNAHWSEPDFSDTYPDVMRVMLDYWNLREADHGG